MTIPSNSNAGMALKVFNYATPVALVVCDTAVKICAQCILLHDGEKLISRRRRMFFHSLNLIITATYVAQSLSLMLKLSTVPDDSLVHTLAQTLFWVYICLNGLSSTSPLPSQISLVLNLALETIVCGFTFSGSSHVPPDVIQSFEGLQTTTLFALLFTIVSKLLFTTSRAQRHDGSVSETQSLLRPSSSHSDTISQHASQYDTIDEQERASEADSPEDRKSLSDDEDDDESEFATFQTQRMRDSGGIIGYLKSFRIFLPYIIPRGNIKLQLYIAIIFFNLALERCVNVLHPSQLGSIVDILAKDRRVPLKEIFLWMAFKIAANGNCGLAGINELFEWRVIRWSRQRLRIAALDHVMELSMDFHDSKDSGEIIKAIEQAGSINKVLQTIVTDIIPAALDVVIAMCYITYLLDIYAALILVAVGIAYVFTTYYSTLFVTVTRRDFALKERLQGTIIFEAVSNWFTVMCLNQKRYTMSRLSNAVEKVTTADMWHETVSTFMFAGLELPEQLGLLAMTILTARRIADGMASVGTMVILQSYWDTIMFPLWILSRSYRRLSSDLIDAERLLQLFQEQPKVENCPDAISIDSIRGRVSFNNVDFAYPGRDTALHNFNMTAEPGKMVALVGETGSGKSTTLKLLMRFYDVTAGNITIDDHDIRDLTLESLRSCFGFVPQDIVLFNASILDNVRYGRVEATDEEIHEACKAASIHDKILSFPHGYASKVGERGVKLSGGERQRVAIARVFLKNPQIVLLDEATSAMDSQTESKIQGALRRLMQGRTTFVVAHRLSTVVDADRILVVDGGKVVEEGSHDELLKLQGRYYELWVKQTSVILA